MRAVRRGVFETNSSSTHALVILSKEDYDAWQRDEKALNICSGKTVPLDENKKITKNEDGSVEYKGIKYDDIYDLMEEEYDDIDDEYAIKEYIEEYAQVEQQKTEDGKVIMSIYRGERW